jgi:hypothetical protein
MTNRFPLILDADNQQLKELATGDNLNLAGNGIVGVDSIEFADGSTAVKSTDVYTQAETDQRIADVIGSAPEALDTLNELAAALGDDPNFAATVTNQLTEIEASVAQIDSENDAAHADFQAAIAAETAARESAVASLQGSIAAVGAQIEDSRTITSSDISVYADSSVAPMVDPNGQSGWYFKNSVAGQKINWYPYINTSNGVDPLRPVGTDTATHGSIQSIWAVVKVYTTTSRPFLSIYTAPTGTGDAASWYKSRWVHSQYAAPTTPGTYLVHFGADPGVHQHLPRIQISNVNSNGRGPMSSTETLLMYAWGTNSASAVNAENFTVEQSGHIFGGRETAYNYVHTGASLADLNALNTSLTALVGAEEDAREAADAALQANLDTAIDGVAAALSTESGERIAGDEAVFNAAMNEIGRLQMPVYLRDGQQVLITLVSV